MRCHYHGPVTRCWPLPRPHHGPRDQDDQPAALPRDGQNAARLRDGPFSCPGHDDPSLPHSIDVQDSRVLDTEGRHDPSNTRQKRLSKQLYPKVQHSPKRTKKRLNCVKEIGINMNEKFVRCTNSWFTKNTENNHKVPHCSLIWFFPIDSFFWSAPRGQLWCHEARRHGMYEIWNLPC